MNSFVDDRGRPYHLGQEIGQGGEGVVYKVNESERLVAKVYRLPPDPLKAAKLRALVALARPELLRVAALPTGTLHVGSQLRGVLMPVSPLNRFHPIHVLYSPQDRKTVFPSATWKFLFHTARNCAAAFERLHNAGLVIGDVNHSNLLVADDADVRLIDCDSFQVRDSGRTYRCTVGVPEYTPPELQFTRFDAVDREPNHDNFGLAVLLFHLLFMGRHPFSGVVDGAAEMPIAKAILDGRFAYTLGTCGERAGQPPLTLSLGSVTESVARLFVRAFTGDGREAGRPRASEWKAVLDAVIPTFRECAADEGHLFPASATACPWCELLERGAPNFFLSTPRSRQVYFDNDLPAMIDNLWNRIVLFTPVTDYYQRPIVSVPNPTPLADDIPAMVPSYGEPPLSDWQLVAGITHIASGACAVATSMFTPLVARGMFLLSLIGFITCLLFELHRQKRRLEIMRRRTFELERRMKLKENASLALLSVESAIQAAIAEYVNCVDSIRRELVPTMNTYRLLSSKSRDELRQLHLLTLGRQYQQWLANHSLKSADIRKVTRKDKALLAKHGILTAADVSSDLLCQVIGLDPSVRGRILRWRERVSSNYPLPHPQSITGPVYDPDSHMSSLRSETVEQLSIAHFKLRQATDTVKRVVDQASRNVIELVRGDAQADADLLVFHRTTSRQARRR